MRNCSYQLEYDYRLIPVKPIKCNKTIEYLVGLTMWIRFSPVFITKNNTFQEQEIMINGKEKVLSDLLIVSYDQNTQNFSFNVQSCSGNAFKYQIIGYEKTIISDLLLSHIEGIPIQISYEEFQNILEENAAFFLNDNNLQSCSYSYHVL